LCSKRWKIIFKIYQKTFIVFVVLLVKIKYNNEKSDLNKTNSNVVENPYIVILYKSDVQTYLFLYLKQSMSTNKYVLVQYTYIIYLIFNILNIIFFKKKRSKCDLDNDKIENIFDEISLFE